MSSITIGAKKDKKVFSMQPQWPRSWKT